MGTSDIGQGQADGAASLGLSGLSNNGSHRLIYLDAESPGSGTVCKDQKN